MIRIRVEKNSLPNSTRTYFIFKDFDKFINKLSANLIDNIDPQNYTIIRGSLRLKIEQTKITESNYKEITYVLNTKDRMCYHVTKATLQSGFVFLDLKIDLWASYIYLANIKNINVRKCNRKISNSGSYDEIGKTEKYEVLNYSEAYENIAILGVLNVKSSTTSSAYVEFFHINPLLPDIKQAIQSLSNIDKVIITNEQGSTKEVDASVMKLYVVPYNMVKSEEKRYGFTYKLRDKDGYIQRLWFVKPSYSIDDIEINCDINKSYFIGVIGNGLKSQRLITNKQIVRYSYAFSYNSVKVSVSIGHDTLDITNSFMIEISDATTNNQLEQISNMINRGASIIGGLVMTGVGLETENPLAIASGLRRTIGGIGGAIADKERSNQAPKQIIVGGCDAFLSFYKESEYSGSYVSPYKIAVANSLINEGKRARKTGANFNEWIESIDEIFTCDLIGEGSQDDDTFIVAIADIDNIPLDAISKIQETFSSGVYIQNLV